MSIHADAFDTLRNCRSLFLKHLGALLQDSHLISGHAIAAIQQGAGAYFDEVIASDQRVSFAEEAHGLTASRITLLAEDDLELGIRLDNMTARLFERTGDLLWKLHLRFVTLLRRPDLPKSDNPVGPKSICRGLDAMFSAAGASTLDQKLELLDRIETYLGQNLPALYAELNDLLERAGVNAAQPAIITSPDSPTAARETAPALSSNALQALQQALAANLAPAAGLAPAGSGAAASLLSQSALEQLMFRLEALERMGRFGPPVIPGSQAPGEPMMPDLFAENPAPSAPKIIRSAELGIPKTASESLAIDTLAMIFEAILDDPELPDALKGAIASLQIKLLKVAMKDSSLFTDAGHPARRVIDRMAEAALGLPLDVPTRHPVCARLLELASALRSKPGSDPADFTPTITALDVLIDDRRQRMLTGAAPYRPLLETLDRRDRLAGQLAVVIERCFDAQPPAAIGRFIDQTWRRVLREIGQEHGPDSRVWQEYVAAIDGLIWSVQPKNDAEERKQLAQRVPGILKVLRAGMARVGLTAAEQEDFLDTCFELQTQALRAGPLPDGSAPEAFIRPAPRLPEAAVAGQLADGNLALATFDYPEHRPPPSRAPAWCEGDWLAFRMADGTPQIARLCATSPGGQRLLLLNPEQTVALAMHPAILDSQLREGIATIRSGQSLFDHAAGRALGKTGKLP